MTPDSSEIAKHVRAVHLTLVLACLVVLTILIGGSPTPVETAHNQLQNVLAIKENWSSWTRQFGQEQLTWLRENGIVPSSIVPSQLFITPEELGRRNLSTQTQQWSVSPEYVLYFYVVIRPPGKTEQETILAWAQKNALGLEEVNAEPPPLNSLQDFRHFWDAAGNIGLSNITDLSPAVYLLSNGEIVNRLSWTQTSKLSGSIGLQLRRTGLGLKGQEKCDALIDTLLSRWKGKFNIMFCGASPVENTQAVLPARVAAPHVPKNLRIWLSREFNFHSVGDNFENTFSELHQITKPYQELSIDNAKVILEGELKRAGDRVQFLGLTLPGQFVSAWGIGIFAIQVYLLFHLYELRFRIVPGDAAVKVAWIGLYTGPVAWIGFILTAVIPPLVVVAAVAMNQGGVHITDLSNVLAEKVYSLASKPIIIGLLFLEFILVVTTVWLRRAIVRIGQSKASWNEL